MYGIGLLGEAHPAAALRVAKQSLMQLPPSKKRCRDQADVSQGAA